MVGSPLQRLAAVRCNAFCHRISLFGSRRLAGDAVDQDKSPVVAQSGSVEVSGDELLTAD